MARFVIFFFFFTSILFGIYKNELLNFDKNFVGSKIETQIKFHQQLKSLYIQSVINEEDKIKIEILKRLIISSNSLNLDDKSYADELRESGISETSINALRKAVIKDIEIQTAQKVNQKLSSQSQENADKKDNVDKVTTQDKKENTQNTIYVLKVNKINQGVELNLSANLDKDALKSFALEQKDNFRFISDFDGILQDGKKEFKFNDYRIVVSQFNPKTIRVVVYAKEKISISIDSEDKKLIILKEEVSKKKIPQQENEIVNEKEEQKTDIKTKNQESKQDGKEKREPLYILDVDKVSNAVVLNLSDNLDEKNVTIFNTKDQKFFRQIVSFKGVLKGNKKNFAFGENSITVTQYNPNLVRVVLSAPKEFRLLKKIDGKNFTLGFFTQNKKTTQISTGKTSNKPLSTNYKSSKIVVIDAGHGGKDSGALSDEKGTLKEKNIALSTALKLGSELKKRGYKVLYTRSSDKFINLRDRTKYANDKRADLFISVHANAAPNATKAKSSEGVETFFLSPARSERSKKAAEKENQGDFEEINYFSRQSILNFLNREKIVASNKLAIDVQKNILTQTRKKYKIVDGGVREAPFWVLVGAQMPAILIEIGYITHPIESKRIASKSFQDVLVKGIADGVESYFYHNR